jgi:Uma2 family endonuclease
MATDPQRRLTIPEYLAFERQSETRHDYLDGEIFSMAGASRNHNRITQNIATSLDLQLEERDCEVFASDLRVRTPRDLFTYPDVVVVCGPATFEDDEIDTLVNPTLIVEVLSSSTEAYDRITKLSHYRRIPSLKEVILISQDRVHIEHFLWQMGSEWIFRETDDLAERIALPSIGCELEIRRIYRRVFA